MRRLRFVACGDSVVWGQGHRHEDKFVVRAAQAICALEGAHFEPEDLSLRAHSGAVLDSDRARREGFVAEWGHLFVNAAARQRFIDDGVHHGATVFPGEISLPFPTVMEQLRWASELHGDADYVFVDGGGNDLDFTHYVNPDDTAIGSSPDEPATASQGQDMEEAYELMRGRFERMLRFALERFPRAVIIATGYYPLLSPSTQLEGMRELFYWASGIEGVSRWVNDNAFRPTVAGPVVAALKALGTLGAWLEGDEPAAPQNLPPLIERARQRVWNVYQFSSMVLARVVQSVGSERVVYAEPFIGRENALFTDLSALFSSFALAALQDPVAVERQTQASAVTRARLIALGIPPEAADHIVTAMNQGARVTTERPELEPMINEIRGDHRTWLVMSLMHPNARGVQSYIDAIVSAYSLWRDRSLRRTVAPRAGSLRRSNMPSGRRSLAGWKATSRVSILRLQVYADANFFRYFEQGFDTWVRVDLYTPHQRHENLRIGLWEEGTAFFSDREARRFKDDDPDATAKRYRNYVIPIGKLRGLHAHELFFGNIESVTVEGFRRADATIDYPHPRPTDHEHQRADELTLFLNEVPVWTGGQMWWPPPGSTGARTTWECRLPVGR